MAKAKAKKLKVTLVRSAISQKPAVVATVKSLGLRKINSSVEVAANPAVLGKIAAVSHLVTVEEMK
ncbi:MAG: 50S ribosomal protein L30 [Spirochaetaceae bacterium]|nr:50S ribosomal protein L30 [Spirochaetaceae bacterium]MBP5328345.1 50S ribosomal protein L30 [Spirochaetaceae bacterium]